MTLDHEWQGVCPTSGNEVRTVRCAMPVGTMYCDMCDRPVHTYPIPGDSLMRIVAAHEARREVDA